MSTDESSDLWDQPDFDLPGEAGSVEDYKPGQDKGKGSLEERAEKYALGFVPFKNYDDYESDYDYRTAEAKRRQIEEHYLAGSKDPGGGDQENWDDVVKLYKRETKASVFATNLFTDWMKSKYIIIKR